MRPQPEMMTSLPAGTLLVRNAIGLMDAEVGTAWLSCSNATSFRKFPYRSWGITLETARRTPLVKVIEPAITVISDAEIRFPLLYTQWAAVSTHRLSMREPPHVKVFDRSTATW